MIKHSKELENAILGACLIEQLAFGRTYGLIDEEKFYLDDNKAIYKIMREMYSLSIPIDVITVTIRAEEKQGFKLNSGGVGYYVCSLTNWVVSTTNLEYHCFLLKEMWQRRELEKITHSGIDLSDDPRKQGYALNERINKILDGTRKKEWYTMDELMFNLIIHQEKVKAGKVEFLTTGFKKIDQLNGGFSPGNMIVIGARPSVGKSALLAKMAIAMAAQGNSVGIISLEMNNTEIAGRLASIETDIEFWRIYRSLFRDEQQHEAFYNQISKHSVNLPIYVSDKTKVDINDIRAKAIKLKHKHGLRILFIDYLQLVESTNENRNYNREQEVSKISRGLKILGAELEIPVVPLCQLSRAVTSRTGDQRYPQLSDLRESGALEQDADVVWMLHRDWLLGGKHTNNEQGESTENEADLLGVKWRNGALFKLPLHFDPQKMKFSEKDDRKPADVWIPPIPEHRDLFQQDN